MQPEVHRIIHQISIITAAKDIWAGNLKMKEARTEFKLKIDTQSQVLSETKKCSTEKGVI